MMTKAKNYMVKLNFSSLSESEFEENLRSAKLQTDREDKIRKFIKFEDRVRSFYSWKLLEKVLRDNFSILPEKEHIDYNAYGKPYLSGKRDIHFNLSHSGEIICCIVDNHPVGIDVEMIASIDISIAADYFSSIEYTYLLNLSKDYRNDCFFKLWTLKESYIKAEGKGLFIPLNSFYFKITDKIVLEGNRGMEWDFGSDKINTAKEQYYLAVCVHKERIPEYIVQVSYKDLDCY